MTIFLILLGEFLGIALSDIRAGICLVLCQANPMDGGAWWAVVHGVARSWTWLSGFTFTFMHWRRKWQPTPVFLPGESQGQGAWWASVYGVAQSQTWLTWLSSSSMFSFIVFSFMFPKMAAPVYNSQSVNSILAKIFVPIFFILATMMSI